MSYGFSRNADPTLSCPANCSYCWSSDKGSPIMSIETIKEVVEWLKDSGPIKLLLPFTAVSLSCRCWFLPWKLCHYWLRNLSHIKPAFALQSNLWLMTLKWPRSLQSIIFQSVPVLMAQRNLLTFSGEKGYFDKTMSGYKIARENGLKVSFICTFTSHSVKQKRRYLIFSLRMA